MILEDARYKQSFFLEALTINKAYIIYKITRGHKALSFIAFASVYTAWRMYKLGGVTELHCIWRKLKLLLWRKIADCFCSIAHRLVALEATKLTISLYIDSLPPKTGGIRSTRN